MNQWYRLWMSETNAIELNVPNNRAPDKHFAYKKDPLPQSLDICLSRIKESLVFINEKEAIKFKKNANKVYKEIIERHGLWNM